VATSDAPSYLPLVGALLGAVIGGFVGAFANGLVRDWQDRKAQDRELKGLLYLIGVEIAHNRDSLKNMHDLWRSTMDQIHAHHLDQDTAYASLFENLRKLHLTREDWDTTKVKLSQLLPNDDLRTLSNHYEWVAVVREILADENTKPADNVGRLSGDTNAGYQQAEAALQMARKYLKVLPDYRRALKAPKSPADRPEQAR
jgi:gas vesicle protein